MTNMQKAPETPSSPEIRTGHRRGPRQNEPRDATVCCLVTKEEREAIDELSIEFARTRSAYIAEWIIGLVEAVTTEGPEFEAAKKKLDDFLVRSRSAMATITAKLGEK